MDISFSTVERFIGLVCNLFGLVGGCLGFFAWLAERNKRRVTVKAAYGGSYRDHRRILIVVKNEVRRTVVVEKAGLDATKADGSRIELAVLTIHESLPDGAKASFAAIIRTSQLEGVSALRPFVETDFRKRIRGELVNLDHLRAASSPAHRDHTGGGAEMADQFGWSCQIVFAGLAIAATSIQ